MCRCSLLAQALVHLIDIDVLLNLDDVLLDAILKGFDVLDVVVLLLLLLRLLLVYYKSAIHHVDVHLVNLDACADIDDSMRDVHPTLGNIHRN